jgi:ferredoxin
MIAMWEGEKGNSNEQCHPSAALRASELSALERLLDHRPPNELKAWLLDFYGPKGELARHRTAVKEALGECDNNCSECGACVPFCEEPLLYQLSLILYMHGKGLFKASKDNFEVARARWEKMHRRKENLSCPF